MERKPRIKNARLVAAIAMAGKTQKQLAREAGVSHRTLGYLVNYRNDAMPETARRIAMVLGTTPAALGLTVYGEEGGEA